jgi:hypothetical protein
VKLDTLDDWTAFVDRLRERGAVAVDVATHADGSIASLKCTLRPPAPAQQQATRRAAPDDDAAQPRKPAPAGLGYTTV